MAVCKMSKYGDCHYPAARDGLCDGHASEWLRSPEFRDATNDETVRGYMRLGLDRRAMMTVNRKYKVRFLKRIAGLMGGEE